MTEYERHKYRPEEINQAFSELLEHLNSESREAFSDAFTKFWDKAKPLIAQIVRKTVLGTALISDTEDLIQQIAMKLLDKNTLRTYQEKGNSVNWISVLAKNVCLGAVRKEEMAQQRSSRRIDHGQDINQLRHPGALEPHVEASYNELLLNIETALLGWSGTTDTTAELPTPENCTGGDSKERFQVFILNYFRKSAEIPTPDDLRNEYKTGIATAKSRRQLARNLLKRALKEYS